MCAGALVVLMVTGSAGYAFCFGVLVPTTGRLLCSSASDLFRPEDVVVRGFLACDTSCEKIPRSKLCVLTRELTSPPIDSRPQVTMRAAKHVDRFSPLEQCVESAHSGSLEKATIARYAPFQICCICASDRFVGACAIAPCY